MNQVDYPLTEQECSLAMMRTAMILHPFDEAFLTLRSSYLLSRGSECMGEMSFEILAKMGMQA